MIQVDPSHWTADFRIARALAEAYHSSMRSDLVFVCVGDPSDLVGNLGPLVGDEMLKYYPHVIGTSDEPVTAATFAACADTLANKWPHAFVVAIEAGYGRSEQLGAVMITDRPLSSLTGVDVPWDFADVTVNAVLRFRPASDRVQDAAGDGAMRRGRGARGLEEARRGVGSDESEPVPGAKKFKPLRPEQIDRARVQKVADVVIDGNLRLLSKIGKQEI